MNRIKHERYCSYLNASYYPSVGATNIAPKYSGYTSALAEALFGESLFKFWVELRHLRAVLALTPWTTAAPPASCQFQ